MLCSLVTFAEHVPSQHAVGAAFAIYQQHQWSRLDLSPLHSRRQTPPVAQCKALTVVLSALQQFSNILHAFVTLFSIMLGGTDLDLFYNSHNPIIGIILLLLFVFTMSMVLLNCLIAIMSDACSRVSLCCSISH